MFLGFGLFFFFNFLKYFPSGKTQRHEVQTPKTG